METLYFYHSQANVLRVRIFDTDKLVGENPVTLFVQLDDTLTKTPKTLKYSIPKSPYREILIHFTVPSHKKLELPLDRCYKIELYNGDTSVEEITNKDGLILSEDKYFEYFVRENILHDRLKLARRDIRYYSGPGKPDIVYRNVDIEVTHTKGQLSFAKFSEDLSKFDKYKSKYKLSKLMIIHDSQSVQPAIRDVLENRRDAWVLDYVTFANYFRKVVSDSLVNRSRINCRGVRKSPLRRNKPRFITETLDLSDPTRFYRPILHKESFKPELLYIRDIRPDDLIYLIEVAYEYKDAYKEREGFKKLLISKGDYLFQGHQWKGLTKIKAIKREFWFRPLIHMGILDGNYRITSIGEHLYRLWKRGEREGYGEYLKYRFLKAPGIKEMIRIMDKNQEKMSKEGIVNLNYFTELVLDELIQKGYLDNREQGIRYFNSIRTWMKYFDFAEFIAKKGFAINKKAIAKILSEYT